MKNKIILTTAALLFLASSGMFAATLYVGTLGTPGGDYYTEIQAAVDAAVPGDLVLVSNGVYNTGGGIEVGSYLTNRVYCSIAIEIRSVDGPDATIILGAPDPDTGGHGPAAVRGACLLMNAGATISGFTMSNGYTGIAGDTNRERGGGGARIRHMNIISNCVIIGNFGHARGGGLNLQVGTAVDCKIINNVAGYTGGGVFAQEADMYNCIVKDNTGSSGGGIYAYDGKKIYNTIVSGNSAVSGTQGKGGGILLFRSGDVQDCTVFDNTAQIWGGGISTENGGVVRRCTIYNNSTIDADGAGMYFYKIGELHDSLVYGNNSGQHGGGMYMDRGGDVYSSTFAQNNAVSNGGGGYIESAGKTVNSIFYENTASAMANLDSYILPTCSNIYSCSDPLPALAASEGSITANPVFVNASIQNFRLQISSPCINAGTNAFVSSSVDLDGNPRIQTGTVDMGCYEFIPEPGIIGLISLLGLVFLRKK